MKIHKTYFALNILIFSFITINIFPNALFKKILGISFASTPFFSSIIVFYLILRNLNLILKFKPQNSNILIFLLSTFVITFFQSIIENNYLVLVRYCFPIYLSFIIYQFLTNNDNYKISGVIFFIYIFFIFLFIIQKFNPLGLDVFICKIINNYQLIIRGSCGYVSSPTFLSPEPSYHSLNVIGLYIFYKLYSSRSDQIDKRKNIIDIMLIINLLIIESELAKFFLILFLFYFFLSKVHSNIRNYLIIILFFSIFLVSSVKFDVLKIQESQIKNSVWFKTVESRFFYNFLGIKNIEINPKDKFLNFRGNEIQYLVSPKGLLEVKNLPVVRNDILKGNKFNLNSSLIYFLYDFGIFLAIPFIWFNVVILRNIILTNNLQKSLIILPYYMVCFLAQSNFSNILMWIIFFYVSKRE